MAWISALKVFNQGKTTWCVPKKGGPEYLEVKRILSGTNHVEPLKSVEVKKHLQTTFTGGRIYQKTKDEEIEEKKKMNEKRLNKIKYAEENWKYLKPYEKIDIYFDIELLGISVPSIMKRGYDIWVKKNRPSSTHGQSSGVPNTKYDKEQRKGEIRKKNIIV